MTYCTTPRKYPMIVRKVCPYCGKGNDILIHRWQENRQRMFCPGTNHASLVKQKKRPEYNEVSKAIESTKDTDRNKKLQDNDDEYIQQLRKYFGLSGS